MANEDVVNNLINSVQLDYIYNGKRNPLITYLNTNNNPEIILDIYLYLVNGDKEIERKIGYITTGLTSTLSTNLTKVASYAILEDTEIHKFEIWIIDKYLDKVKITIPTHLTLEYVNKAVLSMNINKKNPKEKYQLD